MIKLTLPDKPRELTEEMQKSLTENFKANPKSRVWDKDWIKRPLLEMTNGKCAYSEMMLNEEGKWAQIEHIHPKSKYPDEVVEWGNLVPCSNVCNAKKGKLDTKKIPIVNPLIDNPKDYFFIVNGRLCVKDPKCKKAINTLEYCDLNNISQFRKIRIRLENNFRNRLTEICDNVVKDSTYWAVKLKLLMESCGRKHAYSSTLSTCVLYDEHYLKIKKFLIDEKIWNTDYDTFEKEMLFCALPKPM
ncbi:MAG: hypothetical protein J6T82_08990 [Bacteroidaceae bacterium]|nr:hypothetical protein [Bacteroidaceae bacterium]